MRLIIYFLLALSAFFVQSAQLDMSDLVDPIHEKEGQWLVKADRAPDEIVTGSMRTVKDAALSTVQGLFSQDMSHTDQFFLQDCYFLTPTTSNDERFDATAFCQYQSKVDASLGNKRYSVSVRAVMVDPVAKCPPEGWPLHEYPTQDANGNDKCAKLLDEDECPIGHWNKYMSQVITGKTNHCEPRDCDQAGLTKGIRLIPGHDSEGFDSNGGLYCNDGCAYQVKPEQVNNSSSAYATSTGQHCGVYGSPIKKLSEIDDTPNCTTGTTAAGKPTINCPTNGSGDSGNDDNTDTDNGTDTDINNDDKKTSGDDTEDKPKNTCQDGDLECKTENIEIAIENAIDKLIRNDDELHNLMIDVHTANTVSIVDAINDIELSSELDDTMQLLQLENINRQLQALVEIQSEALESGDGGTDDGTGDPDGSDDGTGDSTGDGDGDGDGGGDCDGTPEECTGIGSGDGSKFEPETIDLEDYRANYTGLIPSTTLEAKKCVSLSFGNELCLDFTSIIELIKAFGGLLVLGSWIHSARILIRGLSA